MLILIVSNSSTERGTVNKIEEDMINSKERVDATTNSLKENRHFRKRRN